MYFWYVNKRTYPGYEGLHMNIMVVLPYIEITGKYKLFRSECDLSSFDLCRECLPVYPSLVISYVVDNLILCNVLYYN